MLSDIPLFQRLSLDTQQLQPGEQQHSAPLLSHLPPCCPRYLTHSGTLLLRFTLLSPAALSAASSAKILHAFAVTRLEDPELFSFLSRHLQRLHKDALPTRGAPSPSAMPTRQAGSTDDAGVSGDGHTAQSVAMILNAVAKLRIEDRRLLQVLGAAAREVPTETYTVQVVRSVRYLAE